MNEFMEAFENDEFVLEDSNLKSAPLGNQNQKQNNQNLNFNYEDLSLQLLTKFGIFFNLIKEDKNKYSIFMKIIPSKKGSENEYDKENAFTMKKRAEAVLAIANALKFPYLHPDKSFTFTSFSDPSKVNANVKEYGKKMFSIKYDPNKNPNVLIGVQFKTNDKTVSDSVSLDIFTAYSFGCMIEKFVYKVLDLMLGK